MNANVFCNQCHRIPSQCVCWTSCLDCGQRVTGDSIHTCSPQIKELSDKEIQEVAQALIDDCSYCALHFARAILRKVQEK